MFFRHPEKTEQGKVIKTGLEKLKSTIMSNYPGDKESLKAKDAWKEYKSLKAAFEKAKNAPAFDAVERNVNIALIRQLTIKKEQAKENKFSP